MSVPDVRLSKELYTPTKEAVNVSPSAVKWHTSLIPNTLRTVGLNTLNDNPAGYPMYSPKPNIISQAY